MKKYAIVFIACGMLAFTATSCHDEEHVDTDKADSLSSMPAEMPPPAQTTPDTVAVPPVDPAMDTSKMAPPKM